MTESFLDLVAQRVVVYDGATGTWLQGRGLTVDDYGGEALEGCTDYLGITRPDVIADLHSAYFEVGADVVETNTFGAFGVPLGEYDMAERSHEIALAIVETALKYRPLMTGIEKGQLELAVRPEIERLLSERKRAITLAEGQDALKPITDKMTRARPLQGMMQRGRVYLPSDQPWAETMASELLRFPNGLHDDIVDAASWLARMTINAALPAPPVERFKAKDVPSWRERLKALQAGRKHFMAA